MRSRVVRSRPAQSWNEFFRAFVRIGGNSGAAQACELGGRGLHCTEGIVKLIDLARREQG